FYLFSCYTFMAKWLLLIRDEPVLSAMIFGGMACPPSLSFDSGWSAWAGRKPLPFLWPADAYLRLVAVAETGAFGFAQRGWLAAKQQAKGGCSEHGCGEGIAEAGVEGHLARLGDPHFAGLITSDKGVAGFWIIQACGFSAKGINETTDARIGGTHHGAAQ